jgi:ubiquinone/menaquinone biosynthesis C-methylase UbiE/DNA-binding transcriptional ArsR family regulator
MMQLSVLISQMRAIAEPSRLRVLALLGHGDLSVGEMSTVMAQSQPRLSRHLKFLTEAGFVERHPEGTWVFYRLARSGPIQSLVGSLLASLDPADSLISKDIERLQAIRRERALQAQAYFARMSSQWEAIQRLHVDHERVQASLARLIGRARVAFAVDIGTGTGSLLDTLAKVSTQVEGIDLSHQMLTIARARVLERGLANVGVRYGDAQDLPFAASSVDLITLHQVLHFLDQPERLFAEAARVLKPGGRLFVVDFEPHAVESLRTDHAHRRLGFPEPDMLGWAEKVGLTLEVSEQVSGGANFGGSAGNEADDTQGRSPCAPLIKTRIWVAKRPIAQKEQAA